jgi:Flp pilus assembly protein TadG
MTKELSFKLRQATNGNSSGTRISERGSSLVEMALIIPFLLLLVIGVIDFGRAYYDGIEVANAARAGAQYGLINPGDTSGMEAAAKSEAADLPSSFSPTALSGCMCSDGTSATAPCSGATLTCVSGTRQVNYVQVNATFSYSPIFPWPGLPTTFPLASTATFSAGE